MTPEDLERAVITIPKLQLAELPVAQVWGKIVVVESADMIPEAIAEIRKYKIIGFDTETRPSFKKGQSNSVSLIQFSTFDTNFLFRINITGLSPHLIQLMEDPSILKIGLSIHDDFHNLNKLCTLNPQGFIDLQTYVRNFRIIDASLSKLYAILFEKRISKGQRLTNWEADTLTQAQISYAALDAQACIEIYNYLQSGKFQPLTSKYLTVPEEPHPENTENEDTKI